MRPAWWLLLVGLAGGAGPAAAGPSDRYALEVNRPGEAYPGTTLFGDNSDPRRPVLVEVDMAGSVLWSHEVSLGPGERTGGMDVEWLAATDTILYTTFSGAYEIDRRGRVVWSHRGPSSHDVDRLANGNTLVVWGWGEDSSDPEVREVSPAGQVVWQWHAAPHLQGEKRLDPREGYTHANAAVRLDNGNTLVSLRNFQMLVEVAPSGAVVWKLGDLIANPHNPEILANGNILVNTRGPDTVRELTPAGVETWRYVARTDGLAGVRHNLRLPNGNTLLSTSNRIVEITADRRIVWQLRLTRVDPGHADMSGWLYKAVRIRADRRARPAAAPAAPSATLRRSGTAVLPTEARRQAEARRRADNLMRMDRDGDGRVAAGEFTGQGSFAAIDADGDGFVTRAEAESYYFQRLVRQGETGLGRPEKVRPQPGSGGGARR